MARVRFDVLCSFDAAPRALWEIMIDWPSHGDWIPATTVDVGEGHPTDVGYTFTAWTGIRPVAFEDRMRVTRCDWDDRTSVGTCDVEKLGPILGGTAGFTVQPHGLGALLVWHEDVTVRYLPRFLAPIANRLAAAGFRHGLRSLARDVGAVSR